MPPVVSPVYYRALLIVDLLVFGTFLVLPQLQTIDSPAASAALELDGLGALIAASHPLMVALAVVLRLAFVGLLFFGIRLGWYVLLLSVALSCFAAAIGGIAVLTAMDLLALTLLYLLDGYLLSRTYEIWRLNGAKTEADKSG